MSSIRKILTLSIFICLFAMSWAGTLNTSVDRNTINLGETFQLIITIQGNEELGPVDLNNLNHLFNVIGTANSQQMDIINGKVTRISEFIITLTAKQQGKQVIPPIQIGQNQTQAITIDVTTASQAALSKQNHIVIDAAVDTQNPYVQSEVFYTLKIYYDVSINNAAITPPSANNADIKQIGRDQSYTATYQGKHYNVFQRNYIITPQTSGKLIITAPIFHGNSNFDPQSSSPFGDFIDDNAKPIQVMAKDITLDVKPKPVMQNNNVWLPAKDLQLTETWSHDLNQMHVGEPITRTITIEAKGLSSQQLPELPLPNIQNMNSYPSQPQFNNTVVDNDNVSTRTQKIVYIPTKAATVTIPAIELPWWDTVNSSAQTVHLAAKTLEIQPAINVSLQQSATLSSTDNTLQNHAAEKNNYPLNFWFLAVIVLLVAWIGTIMLWLWSKNKNKPATTSVSFIKNSKSEAHASASIHTIKKTIKSACQANDPQSTYKNLLLWLKLKFPELNLELIKDHLENSELKLAIDQLEQQLYAKNTTTVWNGSEFWKLFSKFKFEITTKNNAKEKNELPELYL